MKQLRKDTVHRDKVIAEEHYLAKKASSKEALKYLKSTMSFVSMHSFLEEAQRLREPYGNKNSKKDYDLWRPQHSMDGELK